jgi:hypothetical protein
MRLPIYRDFFLGQRDPIKPPDGRGKHSKKRAQQWLRENQHLVTPNLDYQRPCNCDVVKYRTVETGEGVVCTGCGLVLRDKCFVHDYLPFGGSNCLERRDYHSLVDISGDNTSPPYQRRHHYAERIKLASNYGPRIPAAHMEAIVTEGWPSWPGHGEEGRSPYELSFDDIKSILNHTFPDDKDLVRKYLERWLQVKIILCGGAECYQRVVAPLMPQNVVYHLYHRFEEFARTFEYVRRFYNAFPKRKNVPYLNTVSRHLLLLDNVNNYLSFKKYFPNLKTLRSRLKNEFMVCAILRFLKYEGSRSHHNYKWDYHCLLSEADKISLTKNWSKWRLWLLQEFRRSH